MKSNGFVRAAIFLTVIFLLGGKSVSAGESSPVSKRPLHFRIEVGVEPVKEITGYLDETQGTGKGYDVAVCDLDGDGKPEHRGSRVVKYHVGTPVWAEVTQPAIKFEHAGRSFAIYLNTFWGQKEIPADGTALVPLAWDAAREDGLVEFKRGTCRAYLDLAAARKAKPVRIGPPFHWVIGTRVRGPHAFVTAALSDESGTRLSFGRRDGATIRPTVRILSEDGPAVTILGDYG
jgi:hypothetical protein